MAFDDLECHAMVREHSKPFTIIEVIKVGGFQSNQTGPRVSNSMPCQKFLTHNEFIH